MAAFCGFKCTFRIAIILQISIQMYFFVVSKHKTLARQQAATVNNTAHGCSIGELVDRY